MAINWNASLVTRDGRPAKLLMEDAWQRVTGDKRRRVETCNFNPPKNDSERESSTVWLHNEEGRCHASGNDSPMDVFNTAA
jgi:hypothetical protein